MYLKCNGRTFTTLTMSYPKTMSAPDLTRKETSDDMAVSPAGATAPDHDKPNSKRTLSKTVSPQHGATESASDEKNRTPTTGEKQATRESDVVALCGCDPNATPKQIIKTLIEKIDAMRVPPCHHAVPFSHVACRHSQGAILSRRHPLQIPPPQFRGSCQCVGSLVSYKSLSIVRT